MDFRIHLLVSGLTLAAWQPAQAQEARPVRADRVDLRRMGPPRGLPAGLASLPESVPAAIYAPRLAELLGDLESAADLFRLVEPAIGERSVPELLADGLWGTGLSPAWWGPNRRHPELARLSTPEGLRSIGVDPSGSVSVLLEPEAGVAVVRFELAHRPSWERWLDQLGGAARARLDVAGERASVLAQDSDFPVTCIARNTRAYCQIGAAEGDHPLGPLEAVSAGAHKTLGAVSGVVTAYTALPDGARAYAVVNPPAMAKWLAAVAGDRLARAHRFSSRAARSEAIRDAKKLARDVRHIAAKVEGTAFGLYRASDGLSVRMETALSGLGARILKSHLRPPGEHARVSRWANSPALMRVVLRTHPQTVERIGRRMGFRLPQSSLTGDLAILTLGVDAECPLAKRKRRARAQPLSWVFLMPTAAAVGLAGPNAADALFDAVRGQLAPEDTKPRAANAPRPHIRGELANSPYEVDVRDDLMLVGTGYGSAGAAARRLRSLGTQSPRREAPLLEASLDLNAVDAAFASGSFDAEHRSELLALEALRLSLKPLLDHVGQLQLTVHARDAARRLSARLIAIPPG